MSKIITYKYIQYMFKYGNNRCFLSSLYMHSPTFLFKWTNITSTHKLFFYDKNVDFCTLFSSEKHSRDDVLSLRFHTFTVTLCKIFILNVWSAGGRALLAVKVWRDLWVLNPAASDQSLLTYLTASYYFLCSISESLTEPNGRKLKKKPFNRNLR